MTEDLRFVDYNLSESSAGKSGDNGWEGCDADSGLPWGCGSSVVSGKYENSLHFGDNLDVLRKMPQATVDLIYLDPPFNSKADYGVIYGTKRGGPSQAQAHAFKDMWTWGPDAKDAVDQTAERHLEAGALLDSFQKVFPASNMMA